ncbi:hypothetical protein AWZ03_014803, partial [Drosophila navojoa]
SAMGSRRTDDGHRGPLAEAPFEPGDSSGHFHSQGSNGT